MAKRKLWGRHRRRHIRNETLTMVWNYTATVVKGWWAQATGNATAAAATASPRLLSWKDWLVSNLGTEEAAAATSTVTVELREMGNQTPALEVDEEQPAAGAAAQEDEEEKELPAVQGRVSEGGEEAEDKESNRVVVAID